jgi:hypothetical protein
VNHVEIGEYIPNLLQIRDHQHGFGFLGVTDRECAESQLKDGVCCLAGRSFQSSEATQTRSEAKE